MSEALKATGTIESVRVAVRVRPLNKREESRNNQNITKIVPQENTLTVTKLGTNSQCKNYKFDHVFPETSSQLYIYQKVAHPIIEQIFKGYNGTIFAYGQTGSGKTYTMSGNQNSNELHGIIPNTFSHIFSKISSESGEKSFVVNVTYIEIYNEEIRDLLSPNPTQKLELRERVDVGVYVKGLSSNTVDSVDAIEKLITLSSSNRKTRSTQMNEVSSRSHAIFTITVEAKDNVTSKTTVAKLNLVDLAGSERVKRSQATGDGFKEATNINQSLFVLSNVISALVEEKSNHIPYRNSKLTRLLQDSLGGNSKTAMIATISPCDIDYDESVNTLRYASRAKLIKNYVRLNIHVNKGLISKFEEEILQLQNKLATIVEQEKEVERQRLKKLSQEKKIEIESEIKDLEKSKNELSQKISAIQNKILIGGHNLCDQELEQKFLLESSFEEIQKLDKSRQELEGKLGEKEIERVDLEDQFDSLQEEDKFLDGKIQRIECLIKDAQQRLDDQQREHKGEIASLFENNSEITSETQKIHKVIRTAVPAAQVKKLFTNVIWNDETCDFEVKGVAHVGNHVKARRRFKKHIPQDSLMSTLVYERKHMARRRDITSIQNLTQSKYLQYAQPQQYDDLEDESDEP